MGECKKDWSSVNHSILSGMGGGRGAWGDILAEACYKLERIMTEGVTSPKGLASRQFISQPFAFLDFTLFYTLNFNFKTYIMRLLPCRFFFCFTFVEHKSFFHIGTYLFKLPLKITVFSLSNNLP